MEQMMASLGFLMVIYGIYTAVNAIPVDPVVKGTVTAVVGLLLIVIAYLVAYRRNRKVEPREGWDYR